MILSAKAGVSSSSSAPVTGLRDGLPGCPGFQSQPSCCRIGITGKFHRQEFIARRTLPAARELGSNRAICWHNLKTSHYGADLTASLQPDLSSALGFPQAFSEKSPSDILCAGMSDIAGDPREHLW
jgi:hypothetical protein